MRALYRAAAISATLLAYSLCDLPASAQDGWSPYRQNLDPSQPRGPREAAAPKAEAAAKEAPEAKK